MKRVGDLQIGEQITYDGTLMEVVKKDESNGGVWCKPIFKNSYKEFLQTPFMKGFTKSLLDDLEKEMEAKQ